jgi:hypothetical protein
MFFTPAPASNATELINYMKDHLQSDYKVEMPQTKGLKEGPVLSTHRVATATIKMTLVVMFASAIFAAPTQPPAQPGVANVGIVYDGPDLPLAEGYLGAHHINLLDHFGLRGELIRLAEYRPDQLAHYSAAFYVSSVKKKSSPKEFLKDVRYSHQPFCWLGQNIDQLLAGSGAQRQFGLRYLGYQQNRTPLVASLQTKFKGILQTPYEGVS